MTKSLKPALKRRDAGFFDTEGIKDDIAQMSNSERADELKAHDRMLSKAGKAGAGLYGEDGKSTQPGKSLQLPNLYGEHRDKDQKARHEPMLGEILDRVQHLDDTDRIKERESAFAARDETEARAAELGPKSVLTPLYGSHRDKDQKTARRGMLSELKGSQEDNKKTLDEQAEQRSADVRERVKEGKATANQQHGMAPEFWDLLSDERKAEYTALQADSRETYVSGEKLGGTRGAEFFENGDDRHVVKKGKSERFMEREVGVAQIAREMGLDAVGQSAMMQTGGGDRVVSPMHKGKSAEDIMTKSDGTTEEGKDAVKRLANANLDDVQQLVLNDIIFNNRDGHMGQYMLLDDGHMVKIDQEALGTNGRELAMMAGVASGTDEENDALSGKSDNMASASSFVAGLPSATAPLTPSTRALVASWDDGAIDHIAELMMAAQYQNDKAVDDGGAEMFDESVRERTVANIRKLRDMVAADTEGKLSARDLFLEATKGTVDKGDGEREEREGQHPTMDHLENAKLEGGWVPEELKGGKAARTTAQRYNIFGVYGKEMDSETDYAGDVGMVSELSNMKRGEDGFSILADEKKLANWDLLESQEKHQGDIRAKIAHEEKKSRKKSKQRLRTKRSKKKEKAKYDTRIAKLRSELNQGA